MLCSFQNIVLKNQVAAENENVNNNDSDKVGSTDRDSFYNDPKPKAKQKVSINKSYWSQFYFYLS